MNILKYASQAAIALVMISGTAGCSFDDEPYDKLTDASIWKGDNLLDEYTTAWYSNMSGGWTLLLSSNWLMKNMSHVPDVFYSDQLTYGRSNMVNSGVGNFIKSQETTVTLYARNIWSSYYTQIQSINRLIGNEAQLPDTYKQHIMGEAHFFRAYYYYKLLQRFGAPLLIDHNYDPLISDEKFPRATYAQAVDFIVNEAKTAAEMLPATQDSRNTGRVTKGAAIMLQAKAYFWAGSPQFQNKSKEYYGFTDDKSQDYMAKAIECYKELEGLGVYGLLPVSGSTEKQIANSYHDLFLTHNSKEAILEYQHGESKLTAEGAHSLDANGLPPSLTGTSCDYCPTQNHVDDYGMRSGYTYNDQDPYVGRDYRFYANILYDGSEFRDSVMRIHYTIVNGKEKAANGLTKYGSSRNNGFTRTGYYMRKFMDPSIRIPYNDNEGSNQNYPIWRYAEALLDHAEAAFRTGDAKTALTLVNQVRERVHMPALTNVTLEDVLKERRVELAFEEAAYWDEIRLGKAFNDLNGSTNPLRTVKIVYNTDGTKTYSYAAMEGQSDERQFREYQYYLPIPWAEVRFQGIEQNEGWTEQE